MHQRTVDQAHVYVAEEFDSTAREVGSLPEDGCIAEVPHRHAKVRLVIGLAEFL
ncbi:hypothetical protein BGX28_006546 [Mortierella sp. GBA30]|nr:hypothetical protein BGX28_006546 [Mortierella sp. GBA30]